VCEKCANFSGLSIVGQQVQKMTVVVELLLGDIPERSVFRQPIMRKPLLPYFQLTQGQHLLHLKYFANNS
jgi:26S proteasome regulatory subunit N3